ncbi:unnamed protein product [Linum tenue]|uniref:FHA domain-containing protein n=1 Tax=Linum tenue TaxID=586396 RepID=A0AAV0LPK7_9ROSI|nr:unnamed protein product [Linum tenue]
MGRHSSDHSISPDRDRGRRSSPPAERAASRHRSSRRDVSPSPVARQKKNSHRDASPSPKEKRRVHTKSPNGERSASLSPRSKRLRRAQAEREADKLGDGRDHGRNRGRETDRGTRKDREGSDVPERERERTRGKGGAHREREAHKVTDTENDKDHGTGGDKAAYKSRGTEDRENRGERKERKHGRDEMDRKSSRDRHERSLSPSDRHHKRRYGSQSPQRAAQKRERDEVSVSAALAFVINYGGADGRNSEDDSVAKMKAAEEALEASQKQKPSFELSGKLAAETNRVRGVTLLFNEPPEARKPNIRWRLYVFKGGEALNEPLYIHRQSCYLFGRERRVADVPTDHPSCSKQHAVIQFRQVEKEQSDGTLSKKVSPYLMDLGSTNKTFINDKPIEPERYYELFEKDTIKFGNSSREYVLLHENSSEVSPSP